MRKYSSFFAECSQIVHALRLIADEKRVKQGVREPEGNLLRIAELSIVNRLLGGSINVSQMLERSCIYQIILLFSGE